MSGQRLILADKKIKQKKMKPTQQQKDNKLIAEFMELTIITDNISYFDTNYKALKNYHIDWNWLMEVVDKIYEMDLYYDRYIDYNSSMISDGKINLGTRINRVYEQVVEFIKWYNENK